MTALNQTLSIRAHQEQHMPTFAAMIDWVRRNGLRMALDVGVNFLLPVLVYDRLKDQWGDVPALLASSGPPLLWSIGGFVRNRRVDALSVLALIGIALSLLAFFGGGSARLLELREKLVTLAIGLAFLGSAAIGRPLIYPLARATMARQSKAAAEAFDAKRDEATVRYTIMVMTLAWGFGLVADFLLSGVLIFALSIHDYLLVGPVIGYATIGGLTLWTALYRRHRERFADALRAQRAAQDQGDHAAKSV
jgi:hypothetical protein